MKVKQFIRCGARLPVADLGKTLLWYEQKLGFYDKWNSGPTDGGIRRDGMRLLFAEDAAFVADVNNSSHSLPLLWFVENIEEIYTEFQQNGIVMADKLRPHPYGLKEFAFTDINGYYIRIAEAMDGLSE